MMLGLQHRHYDERSPAAISKDSFPEHAFFLETQNSVHMTRTVIVREDIQPQTVCTNFVERQVDHLSQDGDSKLSSAHDACLCDLRH